MYPVSSPYRAPLPGTPIRSSPGRVEVFDRSSARLAHEEEVKSVFEGDRIGRFGECLKGMVKEVEGLRHANESVVELNESLSAYLFGLLQNAWCVNLKENVAESGQFVGKMERVSLLTKEVERLRREVEAQKVQKAQRVQKVVMAKPKAKVTPKLAKAPGRKTFLRAGGGSGIRARQNRPVPRPPPLRNFNLPDDSIDSNNTSEVQTLTRVGGGSKAQQRAIGGGGGDDLSWQVKHVHPFR